MFKVFTTATRKLRVKSLIDKEGISVCFFSQPVTIISQTFQMIFVRFGMLLRPVGLMSLKLVSSHPVQGSELC